MGTIPKFTRDGASANIDFYRASDPEWGYVEVLIHSIGSVNGKTVILRPPRYNITIMRRAGGYSSERFTYIPKRTPSGSHLPDSTLTRLVRERLQQIGIS